MNKFSFYRFEKSISFKIALHPPQTHAHAHRCFSAKAGREIRTTTSRKHAIGVWSVFVLSVDTKTFFILEHIYTYCGPPVSAKAAACNYSHMTRSGLTLLHTATSCAVFIHLLGARRFNERRPREVLHVTLGCFVAFVDLCDVIELKSSLWEAGAAERVGFSLATAVYAFAFVAILFVGVHFFFRMPNFERNGASCGGGGVVVEFGQVLAASTSFVTVNVGTTVVRSMLVANRVPLRVSMVLVAKNALMIVIVVSLTAGSALGGVLSVHEHEN